MLVREHFGVELVELLGLGGDLVSLIVRRAHHVFDLVGDIEGTAVAGGGGERGFDVDTGVVVEVDVAGHAVVGDVGDPEDPYLLRLPDRAAAGVEGDPSFLLERTGQMEVQVFAEATSKLTVTPQSRPLRPGKCSSVVLIVASTSRLLITEPDSVRGGGQQSFLVHLALEPVGLLRQVGQILRGRLREAAVDGLLLDGRFRGRHIDLLQHLIVVGVVGGVEVHGRVELILGDDRVRDDVVVAAQLPPR